jgi:hypothetical protein
MKIGKRIKTLLIISGALVLTALLFFGIAGSFPIAPEADWHLQFHITDSSNVGMAGVRVQVNADGKVTLVNMVFHVEPKRWNFEGITDTHGDYRLSSRACALYVSLSKNGFSDAETNFHGTGIAADASQSLHITMDHK